MLSLLLRQVWAVDGWRLDGDAASNDMHYLGVFVAIGVASLVFAFVRILLMVRGAVSASRSMHRKLLDKVLRLRMSFYDTQVGALPFSWFPLLSPPLFTGGTLTVFHLQLPVQPSGRIINRFTKDVEAMDVQLSASIGAFLVCAASTVASLAIICTAAPWFIIAVVPLAMCYG